jgi:hypothetical protein
MYMAFMFQQSLPEPEYGAEVVYILSQISDQLRNPSDPIPSPLPSPLPKSPKVLRTTFIRVASVLSTFSLALTLLDSVLVLSLKHWMRYYALNLKTFHNPEEQARNRELFAQGLKRWAIPSLFELLRSFMQLALYLFFVGAMFAMFPLGVGVYMALLVTTVIACSLWQLIYRQTRHDPYAPFVFSKVIWKVPRAWRRERGFLHEAILDPEIARVGISNCLFIHTSMVPRISLFSFNFSAFQSSIHHSVSRP